MTETIILNDDLDLLRWLTYSTLPTMVAFALALVSYRLLKVFNFNLFIIVNYWTYTRAMVIGQFFISSFSVLQLLH